MRGTNRWPPQIDGAWSEGEARGGEEERMGLTGRVRGETDMESEGALIEEREQEISGRVVERRGDNDGGGAGGGWCDKRKNRGRRRKREKEKTAKTQPQSLLL